MNKQTGHALHLARKSASIFVCHRSTGLVTTSLSEFMAAAFQCKDCLAVAKKAAAKRIEKSAA